MSQITFPTSCRLALTPTEAVTASSQVANQNFCHLDVRFPTLSDLPRTCSSPSLTSAETLCSGVSMIVILDFREWALEQARPHDQR